MKKQLKKIVPSVLTLFLSCNALADDGPRMYWNVPNDLNILQIYAISVQGNIDSQSAQTFNPDLSTDMNIVSLVYNRTFDVVGRASIFTVSLTAGNASGSIDIHPDPSTTPVTLPFTLTDSARGIGDLYFQGTFNIFGGPALNMEEFGTYEQRTILYFLIGVSAPTGKYDNKSSINMGANRWALKLGLPFVQTLGSWNPVSITTLEILPSVWLYGSNDNSGLNSQKLTQDPLFNVEVHLTQNLSANAFVALDYVYQDSGETYLDGNSQGNPQSVDSLGMTFGYQVDDEIQFVFRYSSTLNPSENELSADMFQLNVNYMW